MTLDQAWLAFGLLGQLIFGARFIVQWIASEKKRESHIPIVFWYLSIVGGANLSLELSSPRYTFLKFLKAAVMITLLRVTFDNPKVNHPV